MARWLVDVYEKTSKTVAIATILRTQRKKTKTI
jgi:hypothetical protein